jgi:ABC-2 type transport system permease protein
MRARRAIWEVARRELVERSRSRALRISFVLVLVLAVGGAIAAARVGQATPTDDVGLVGPRAAATAPALRLAARTAGRHIQLHRLESVPAASRAVRDGRADVVLVDGSRLIVKRGRSGPAVSVVQDAVAAQRTFTRLRALGLSQAQALDTVAPRPLPVDVLEPAVREADQGFLSVGLLALFTALVAFGNAVAVSVTEEKSSRVVELLLTTMSPRRLLTGKVLGIGLLGVAQLAITGAAALAAGRLAGGAGLPSGATGTVALVVLWFLLGYVFYSVAYAAAGALVSRQEDLSAASAAITAVLVGAFWLSMLAVDFGREPNTTVAQIAAFVPPTAPMIVPTRVVAGDMGAIGLSVAVGLELVGTVGLIMLAARVYERAILRIGAPVRLRGLLSDERQGREPAPRVPSAGGRLRSGVAVLVAGAALVLIDGPGIVEVALVVVGLVLVGLHGWGKRNALTR